MNYPIWGIPAPGLLIAAVAILHVFVSHFAVGGGLFLVLTERKARRENDGALLEWLRRHTRFFVLLTLVFGAVTGVGIWFTIGLVHPAATSSLINIFVWGWAIEWAFFVTEIAAAMVYFYGWDRLTPKQHLAVGWIYFVSAWLSLVVINGILTFMLTPGAWTTTRGFLDGFLNPTYWPAVFIRTFGAIGLAGVYALFTASWIRMPELKAKLARYAAIGWVLPMAIGLPLSTWWYFRAANAAGIPVRTIFESHRIAGNALRAALAATTLTIVVTFVILFFRRERFGRFATGLVMVAALVAIGGSEWAREDLRKPYVIGSYMYVNAIREPHDARGILATAKFTRLPANFPQADAWTLEDEARAGGEVFRLTCSQCHTTDGYLAIRPLVQGRSATTIEGTVARLATWRNLRMPPFAGTDAEARAVAVYLARLGGGKVEPRAPKADGAAIFEANCAMCHGPASEWPIAPRVTGQSAEQLYEVLGQLPQRNEMMPPFEGTDAERRALAQFLAAQR
jgi:mono/diheme cytochrome c family protein